MNPELAKLIAMISTEWDIEFSKDRIDLWRRGLDHFTDNALSNAVQAYMRTADGKKYPPRLPAIIEICEILCGRVEWLDADEAWARAPKAELDSAMVTNEIVEAIAAARDLLDHKDRVAARMTFKAAYERLTAKAKLEGRLPVYFLSAGGEKSGREHALVEGIRMGQITVDHAISLVTADRAPYLIQASQVENPRLLERPSKAGLQHLQSLLLTLNIKRPPTDDGEVSP